MRWYDHELHRRLGISVAFSWDGDGGYGGDPGYGSDPGWGVSSAESGWGFGSAQVPDSTYGSFDSSGLSGMEAAQQGGYSATNVATALGAFMGGWSAGPIGAFVGSLAGIGLGGIFEKGNTDAFLLGGSVDPLGNANPGIPSSKDSER